MELAPRSQALVISLLAEHVAGLELKWTPAPDAGSLRFSRRYRDAHNEEDLSYDDLAGCLATGRGWSTCIFEKEIAGLPLWTYLAAACLFLVLRTVRHLVRSWRRWRSEKELLADSSKVPVAPPAATSSAGRKKKGGVKATNSLPTTTIRVCRFCDVEMVSDEYLDAHVAGKKHQRLAKLATSDPAAAADCWVWREVLVRESEARAPAAAEPPPAEAPVATAKGRWEKVEKKPAARRRAPQTSTATLPPGAG